jgi:hypothetical protein
MESIAERRPLDRLAENERPAAEALRVWVRTDLAAGIDTTEPTGGGT